MDRDQVIALMRSGTKIRFGRLNGDHTLGTIVKVNGVRAKVRQEEERTHHRIGTEWNVPFGLIHPLEGTIVPPAAIRPPAASAVKLPINDGWLHQNAHALHILDGIYASLSPENLTCDGEAPRHAIMARKAVLDRQKAAVFILLERQMDETECYEAVKRLEELEEQNRIAGIVNGDM